MEAISFHAPSRIVFDAKSTHKIGPVVKEIGSRPLLVTVKKEFVNLDPVSILKTSIDKHTNGCIIYDDIPDEPDTEQIDTAVHFATKAKSNVIVAFGSIESFNVAKAVALLVPNNMFAADLIHGKKDSNNKPIIKNKPLPIITIPNLPSMGEEVSPQFTIVDYETKVRYFFHDPDLYPALSYVDPFIPVGLRPEDVSRSSVATLVTSVEAILNKKSNEITNTMALRSIELVKGNLVSSFKDPHNEKSIANLSLAALLSGMAYSSSHLGLCFAIGLALSTRCNLELPLGMGIILPHVMEFYLTSSPARYVQIARALGQDISDISVIEAAIKAVEGVRILYSEFSFPQRLSDFGISKADLPPIAALAVSYGFLKYAPRMLNKNEIEAILIAAY